MTRSRQQRHPHYGRSKCGVCSGMHQGRPENAMSIQEELAELEPCDDRTPFGDSDDLCSDPDCWTCYPFFQEGPFFQLRVTLLEMCR